MTEDDAPFPIARVYFIYGTSPDVTRGHHAHRACGRVLRCVTGECTVELDDGARQWSVTLSDPEATLLAEPMQWLVMRFGPGAVLVVLASHPYDEADYIRNRAEFELLAHGARTSGDARGA